MQIITIYFRDKKCGYSFCIHHIQIVFFPNLLHYARLVFLLNRVMYCFNADTILLIIPVILIFSPLKSHEVSSDHVPYYILNIIILISVGL